MEVAIVVQASGGVDVVIESLADAVAALRLLSRSVFYPPPRVRMLAPTLMKESLGLEEDDLKALAFVMATRELGTVRGVAARGGEKSIGPSWAAQGRLKGTSVRNASRK
jgi:hypothetical protein